MQSVRPLLPPDVGGVCCSCCCCCWAAPAALISEAAVVFSSSDSPFIALQSHAPHTLLIRFLVHCTVTLIDHQVMNDPNVSHKPIDTVPLILDWWFTIALCKICYRNRLPLSSQQRRRFWSSQVELHKDQSVHLELNSIFFHLSDSFKGLMFTNRTTEPNRSVCALQVLLQECVKVRRRNLMRESNSTFLGKYSRLMFCEFGQLNHHHR